MQIPSEFGLVLNGIEQNIRTPLTYIAKKREEQANRASIQWYTLSYH